MVSRRYFITRFLTFLFLAFFILTSLASTLGPRDTPDNRCGPRNGGNCQSLSGVSQCCSQFGFCGDSPGHCGAGCQPGFGRCDGSPVSPPQPPQAPPTPGGRRPQFGSVPYGSPIFSCNQAGTIALTFDDGPYLYTNELLDLLRQRGVKATFFVTGNNLGKGGIDNPETIWPAVIRRAYAEGHQIASHTWDHRNLNELSDADRRFQMIRNEQAFMNIMGRYPTYMRAPFVQCSGECLTTMEMLGYHVIVWDFNTDDYNNVTPELIERSKLNVEDAFDSRRRARYESMMSIAHDIHRQTVFNLTAYQIDAGISHGYRHVTLGECLGDPPINWYRT